MAGVLARSALTAGLAGLLFGFDTAVIAGVTSDLRHVFALGQTELGITVSTALWGTLVGALAVGKPGDRYGARDSLKLMALMYLVSAIGCALAWSWPVFLVFRVIGGLAIGGSSVLAPVYISEIAPARRRGVLVGLFQIFVVTGILAAYCSNFLIGQAGFGALEWRAKLCAPALPAALVLGLLYSIPNSPRWLIAKGRAHEALAVLKRLGEPDPEGEAAEIVAAVAVDAGQSGERLSLRRHAKPLFLAVTVALFNQLSGINAILYYLNDIFAAAGFGKVSSDEQSIAIGATNLLFTLAAMAVIDRVGRKPLLLIGSVGTAVCLAAAGVILSGHGAPAALLPVLIGFIAAFAFSQGAVIWVYISEVFPTSVRSRGQSVGCATHWIANAAISGLFPYVAAKSRGAPFMVFAAMMALQFVVVLLAYPETRGVSLEAMSQALGRKTSRMEQETA
jgi:sugar porter (SP) family MFS transporter